jgi:hypothetical protein
LLLYRYPSASSYMVSASEEDSIRSYRRLLISCIIGTSILHGRRVDGTVLFWSGCFILFSLCLKLEVHGSSCITYIRCSRHLASMVRFGFQDLFVSTKQFEVSPRLSFTISY